MSTALAIGISVVLLVVNAFFVGAEFALISVRRSQIEPRGTGRRPARPQRAVGPGARVGADGRRPAGHHARAPWCSASSPSRPSRICWSRSSTRWACRTVRVHPISFVIALSLATYLHMLLGEMVPKNIALAGPVRAVLLLAPLVTVIVRILHPAISVLNWIANRTLRAFGVEPQGRGGQLDVHASTQVAGLVVHESTRERQALIENERRRADRRARVRATAARAPRSCSALASRRRRARQRARRREVEERGRADGFLALPGVGER